MIDNHVRFGERMVATVVVAMMTTIVAADSWPSDLEFLKNCSATAFHGFVAPLAQMTNFSYTATSGSYHDPAADNGTVIGWTRGATTNPEAGGMRALTFLRGDFGVVAFRGTDLGGVNPSSKADSCADAFLSGSELPAYCAEFSAETIDYFARALDHAAASSSAHPNVKWLYTGHSLGAQLASAVAAVRGALALTFSCPAVASVLRNRTKVDPEQVPAWQAVALYNEWDPIRYDGAGQLVGSSCDWSVSPTPLGCSRCRAAYSMQNPECLLCFSETHIYSHYNALVASGSRPQCQTERMLI